MSEFGGTYNTLDTDNYDQLESKIQLQATQAVHWNRTRQGKRILIGKYSMLP